VKKVHFAFFRVSVIENRTELGMAEQNQVWLVKKCYRKGTFDFN